MEGSMSYAAVKTLAREHPDWLVVVKGCYEIAGEFHEFKGKYVRERVGWFPGLTILVRYGILRKVRSVATGAWYTMPDRVGVGRALGELGYL